MIDQTPLRVFLKPIVFWVCNLIWLNHSNFLITNRRHGWLLWNLLAQQDVKVLIAAPLPASKWSGKVSSAVELLINQAVRCKFFPIIIAQSLDPDGEHLEVDEKSTSMPIAFRLKSSMTLNILNVCPSSSWSCMKSTD